MVEEIEKLVKEEKLENIVLKIFLIIICVVTVIFNSGQYIEIFLDKDIINSYEDIKKAIDENKKFVTIDLSNVVETRFSLQNNRQENAAKVYEISYEKSKLLVVLKNNTAITNKIRGELLKGDQNINVLSNKLKEESEDKLDYFNIYFSNMDYIDEEMLVKRRFYISSAIIGLLVLSMFHDIYKFLNPRKTFLYKRYVKKMSKLQQQEIK